MHLLMVLDSMPKILNLRQSNPVIPTIVFNNILQYSYEVTHLGHILTPHLDDKNDIIRAIKDLNRKVNSLFCIFRAVDPFVKCFRFNPCRIYLQDIHRYLDKSYKNDCALTYMFLQDILQKQDIWPHSCEILKVLQEFVLQDVQDFSLGLA